MPKYHVEIGYRTKRGGVAVGMEVEAFGPDEAEEIAHDKILKGYPRRKWQFTKVMAAGATTSITVPVA